MIKPADRIFLVGPMGAGKTTIGRLLAKTLKLEFIDSDLEIEKRCGADIPWIFDVEGESGFRIRERNMIEELTTRSNIVLATGGGAALSAESRKYLSSRGRVVYLMATIEQQLERTARDQKRPLLQNIADPKSKLTELMQIRDPLYREIADYVIQTGSRNPKAVCADIVKALNDDDRN
jgi:shikimate kinase